MTPMATSSSSSATALDLTTFLPYRLATLSGLTQRLLEAMLSRSGVTIVQWRVYLCLLMNGPSHLNGIIAFTHLPQSSLSRSIAAMHDRGLLRNARDASDRRIARIEITPKGRRHLAVLTREIDAACAAAFQLSPDEETRLIHLLDELIARLGAWRDQENGTALAIRSGRTRRAPTSAARGERT
jgi:DNA-binding MarR family transcriptional regulator